MNFDLSKPTRKNQDYRSGLYLYDLYLGFRESLKTQNMAYEGMIFREKLAEKDENFYSGVEWDMFIS